MGRVFSRPFAAFGHIVNQIIYMHGIPTGKHSFHISHQGIVAYRAFGRRVHGHSQLFCDFIFRDQADGKDEGIAAYPF